MTSSGVSSNDPFADHQSPDHATFEEAHHNSSSSTSATHDPILHGHLLQSKYRGAGFRNLGSKWRHVVLNIRTGELCLYQVEQDEGGGAAGSVMAKNRTKSELYFLPRDNQSKGGRTSNSKAAALVGSNLPEESDLILRLPAGTWTIKDLVGNDTAYIVKYDLRSIEVPASRPSEQAAEDSFFVNGDENASIGMSTVQSEFTSATTATTAGGLSKWTKSKGKITLRCPGGGNEKAMWQTAASKCGGIDAIAPELLEEIAPQSKSQLSSIGKTVSTQSKSAFKILSKSKPVKQIGKTVPKSIQPKNVTWRYRKDFTAVGALNMSVLVKGPLPNSALSEMHRSIVQEIGRAHV